MPSYEAGEAYLSILPSMRGFAQRLKRELSGVRVELEVPVQLRLDRRGLAALRDVARTLPAIVLDADSSAADREIAAVRARIERLSGQTIGLDISGDGARAELDAIRAELQRLGRESPAIAVRVDAAAAEAALADVRREAGRLDGRRINLRVVADVGQAVTSLASLALAANAFANRRYRFSVEADTFGAVASVAALVAKVGLLGGLTGVVGGFGGALGGLGAAGAVAAGGLVAAVVASLGVGKALSALSAQQAAAAQTADQSARQQQSAAFAIASAQSQVQRAAESSSRARRDGARSVAEAEKQAGESVARAGEQAVAAHRGVDQALMQQAVAQRNARAASLDLRTAQDDLTDAWEAGRRSLADLQDQLDSSVLDQRQAAIDLRDARDELTAAQTSGDPRAIERAQLAVDRQIEQIDQLGKRTARAQADNAKGQAAGVAGTREVVSAQDAVAAAQTRLVDTATAALDAQTAVDDARTKAAQADAAVVAARVAGAEKVAGAHESADQRVADADQRVADAQRSLQQALAQTGSAGESAANAVETAFAALSPAAAGFARYLFGLQPLLQGLSAAAAEQFFPPLQAGLGLLVAQAPQVTGIVSTLAGAMGQGLQLVLTQLASPVWMQFFGLLASSSTTLIPGLFGALMQLAGAAAVLITDLLPLAPASFDLLNQLSALLVILSPFIAQLLGGLIPAASAFLSALTPLGPVLAALQPILLVLGQVFAQVLLAVLQALAPILVALTPLIQALAVQFATSLVGAIQGATPILIWLADWLSANPDLVIGVISVLAGFAAAFQPILFVLGLVVTALHAFLVRAAAMAVLTSLGLEATVFGRAIMLLLSPLNLVQRLLPLIGRALLFLGRAVLGALGPIGWLITAVSFLYSSNAQFRDAINGLLGVLGTLVGQLASAVMPIFDALGQVLSMCAGVFSQLVGQLAVAVIPIITMLADVLQQLVAAVLPPLMSLVRALLPVILALGRVFVDLVAGALGPLISLFGQLVAAVLPPLISILTGVVIPVITWLAQVITAVLVWVINNVLLPAINGIVPFFRMLGDVAVWLWTNAIKPAFDFIAAAAQVLFAIVFVVLVTPFILAFRLLAAVVTWWWETVLRPIWDLVAAGAMWLWTVAIKPAFEGIGFAIAWVYANVIKPALDGLVWLWQNVIAPVAMWLWHNVIEPVWSGIGAVISLVWTGVIQPVFDALVGGVDLVRQGFESSVGWIGQIWEGLKRLLAAPINFLINTVFNQGILPAWNFVADLLPGIEPIGPLAPIPEYRAGGLLRGPGTGTSDSILAAVDGGRAGAVAVSNGEFVVSEAVTRATLPFLTALNSGDGEALQAAGGLAKVAKAYHGPSGIRAYASGGPIDVRVDEAKRWLSGDALGIPYTWGGGGPNGMDCSGMVAAVTHILSGRSPYSGRIGTTATMPWGGFAPGIDGAWAVGNKKSDHMAGTLAGQNVEQHGPTGTPFEFPSRWGADNTYFPQQFHLQELGGGFVSGGTGGDGGLGFIMEQIRGFFTDLTDPPIQLLENLFPSPPQFGKIAASTARKFRDGALDFLLGAAPSATGGPAPEGMINNWIMEALGLLGFPASYARGIYEQIITESGGDPSVTQHGYVDVNTGGNEAQGIMQVIPPTFRANMLPGHGDPFNPVDNIIAGSRYAMGRYGSSWFGSGPQHNHGYDQGGVADGIGWWWKGTGLDERVLDPTETQAYPTLTTLARELEVGRVPAPTTSSSTAAAAAAAAASAATQPGTFTGDLYLDSGEFLGRVRGEVRSELAGVGTTFQRGRRP